jgi:hypothetical protein
MATDNGETIPTKPSFRSTRETIEAGWRDQRHTVGSAFLDTLDAYRAKAEAIATGPYKASVREQLLEELRVETWAALDAAEKTAIHRQVFGLEQEEGRTRAAIAKAGEDPQALFKQQRMLAFRARVSDARTGGEIHTVIGDAELSDDPEAMRMTLAAALARLSALAEGARVPSAKASVQKAAAEVEARASEFRKRHPAPSERLRQLENEQANVAMSIAASARFAARMYRLRRGVGGPDLRPVPSVANTSRIVEGPAFDALLAGRNSTNVRR